MTPQETREALAKLAPEDRCHPTCKGWDVFNGGSWAFDASIQRCDDCAAALARLGIEILDEDVQELPEAQAALAAEQGEPADA